MFYLLINAIVAGLLIGGLYVAVTIGLSISFGILDIVNIAHPAFIILGAYIVYIVNLWLGLDPILTGAVLLPVFYLLGAGGLSGLFRLVRATRPDAPPARARVLLRPPVRHRGRPLSLTFGVDYRFVTAAYIGPTLHIGYVDLPLRMLVPGLAALVMFGAAACCSCRADLFLGRAIMAVAQDQLALRLMGASPTRIKRIAFGISIATTVMAGALPHSSSSRSRPSVGREFIGRVSSCGLRAGRHGQPDRTHRGAAMLLGVVESLDRHVRRAVLGSGGQLRPVAADARVPARRAAGTPTQ